MAVDTGTTVLVEDRIVLYGADWCSYCRHAKAVLDAEGADYRYADLVAAPAEAHVAERISGARTIPVVVFPDGVFYVAPTRTELAAKIWALRAEAEPAGEARLARLG